MPEPKTLTIDRELLTLAIERADINLADDTGELDEESMAGVLADALWTGLVAALDTLGQHPQYLLAKVVRDKFAPDLDPNYGEEGAEHPWNGGDFVQFVTEWMTAVGIDPDGTE